MQKVGNYLHSFVELVKKISLVKAEKNKAESYSVNQVFNVFLFCQFYRLSNSDCDSAATM